MILKVAWRNIWRNGLRSTVIIIALALGLWAGVFSSAFVQGMMKQKMDSVVRKEMSHFQVHDTLYRDEPQVNLFMENSDEILDDIKTHASVESISSRAIVPMDNVSILSKNGAIKLIGIEPSDEAKVTLLDEDVTEGEYFEGIKKNPILISEETAKEYRLHLKSKVIFKFLDINGVEKNMNCRVVGIYNSGNPMMDKMNAYVLRSDLQRQLELEENQYHEIAVYLNEHNIADNIVEEFQSKYTDLEIASWKDLSPGMRMMMDMMGMYTVIIVGIILFALLFSILNVMLMAVLERVREIGMLMAVGMAKQKVFAMVMLETLFLSIVGGVLGLLLSWLSINYYGTYGIYLGDAAYGEMGFSNTVYPYIDSVEYINVTAMVFFMAMIAAIFPSIKALKLKPVEAIRKI